MSHTANDPAENEKNRHAGSTLESFLREDGIYEEVKTEAIKAVLAYKLEHFQGIPMRLRGFPSGRRPASGFHAQPEEWPHGLAHTAMTQHSVKLL